MAAPDPRRRLEDHCVISRARCAGGPPLLSLSWSATRSFPSGMHLVWETWPTRRSTGSAAETHKDGVLCGELFGCSPGPGNACSTENKRWHLLPIYLTCLAISSERRVGPVILQVFVVVDRDMGGPTCHPVLTIVTGVRSATHQSSCQSSGRDAFSGPISHCFTGGLELAEVAGFYVELDTCSSRITRSPGRSLPLPV